MSIQRVIAEDQRRRVLALLAEDRGYSHNANVIRSALGALGHDIRIDQVSELIQWLAGAGLLRITAEGPPAVVTLTQRGFEAASGRIVVPGVALDL